MRRAPSASRGKAQHSVIANQKSASSEEGERQVDIVARTATEGAAGPAGTASSTRQRASLEPTAGYALHRYMDQCINEEPWWSRRSRNAGEGEQRVGLKGAVTATAALQTYSSPYADNRTEADEAER